MNHVIKLPPSIYSRLEQHAEGFDTPVNVIEKLLNHYEGVEDSPPSVPFVQGIKDWTRYSFNDNSYGKGRLVLAVVQQYIEDNPTVTFEELASTFPKRLQGSIGVVNKHAEVVEAYINKKHKRHFLKEGEHVHLSDCDAAVCTEWGAGNIENFIQTAQSLGYTITPVTD